MTSVITKEFEAIKVSLEALEPLDQNQRDFAIKMILARLGMDQVGASVGKPRKHEVADGDRAAPSDNAQAGVADQESIKDFLKRKRPQTEMERLICIAYYLNHAQQVTEFKTRDITTLNGQAHQPAFSNAAATANNAVRQSRFLGQAASGKKRITTVGEALVEALPNRELVDEAIKEARPGKRNSTKKRKRKKAKAS